MTNPSLKELLDRLLVIQKRIDKITEMLEMRVYKNKDKIAELELELLDKTLEKNQITDKILAFESSQKEQNKQDEITKFYNEFHGNPKGTVIMTSEAHNRDLQQIKDLTEKCYQLTKKLNSQDTNAKIVQELRDYFLSSEFRMGMLPKHLKSILESKE